MSIGAAANAMQRAYMAGDLTYPRARDRALSQEGVAVIERLARALVLPFDAALLPRFGAHPARGAHEAPRPTRQGIERALEAVQAPLWAAEQDTLTLGQIARRLLLVAAPIEVERPDTQSLPEWAQGLSWSRPAPGTPTVLAGPPPPSWRTRRYGLDELALRAMRRHGLGRPSTYVDHAERLAHRGIIHPRTGGLTARGRRWLEILPDWLARPEGSARIERALNPEPASDADHAPRPLSLGSAVALRISLAIEAAGDDAGSDLYQRLESRWAPEPVKTRNRPDRSTEALEACHG